MYLSKTFSQIRSVTLPLLAVFLATGSQAVAKDNPPEQVTIIAHLPLPGTTVSKMFLQPENGKQYLYLQQASERGFSVIDVTKPNKPAMTKRSVFPNTAAEGKLQVFRDGFAIAETPETHAAPAQEPVPAKVQPAADAARPQSVRVLDLSDPANPRTLKTFEGVTSVVPDNGRNLIYLTNSEGLWILRHKRPPAHQICDSESGFSPIADCYAY
jgi:hypothetical protein